MDTITHGTGHMSPFFPCLLECSAKIVTCLYQLHFLISTLICSLEKKLYEVVNSVSHVFEQAK